MSRHPLATAILSVALFTACSPAVESATFATHSPRAADAEVRVFRTQRPDCEYEEIGFLIWRPQIGWETLDDGVADMRERAREMGGDAIIDFAYGQRSTGMSTTVSSDSTGATSTSSIDTEDIATGTVVRYTGPGCEG